MSAADDDVKKAAFSSLSAKEIVSVVDASNNVIGSVERARMRSENLLHRSTYIFIQNSRGQFYVQKRTMIKDYCPGYFDPAPGGVLQAGETYADGAKRELQEEMGIKDVPLTHCFLMLYEDSRVRTFGDVWYCVYDGDLKLQAEEVESVHMMTLDEILQRARSGEKFCPDSLTFLGRFKEWLDNRSSKKPEETT